MEPLWSLGLTLRLRSRLHFTKEMFERKNGLEGVAFQIMELRGANVLVRQNPRHSHTLLDNTYMLEKLPLLEIIPNAENKGRFERRDISSEGNQRKTWLTPRNRIEPEGRRFKAHSSTYPES